jgi:hypothetical protein
MVLRKRPYDSERCGREATLAALSFVASGGVVALDGAPRLRRPARVPVCADN